MCGHVCHGARAEVGGQLVGAGSFLPSCEFWGQDEVDPLA